MSKSFRNSCMACYTEPKPNMEFINYICWQREICPDTKRIHWQTYVEFKDKFTVKKCQSYVGVIDCHLATRAGKPEEAKAYCCKSESRDIDALFIEFGKMQKTGQGNRSDIIDLCERIKNNGIIEDFEYFKYSKNITDLKAIMNQTKTNEFRIVSTCVIIGVPECGKTSLIYKKHGFENCYKLDMSSSECWFDGYHQESILIIDDFYGWIKYGQLLNILDGFPLKLQIKHNHTYANWTKVYITSNAPMHEWYNRLEISALTRRIEFTFNMEMPANKLARIPIVLNNINEFELAN